MPKLNQVLAIEKATKARVQSDLTEMHHTLQKPALLNGFSKTYQKRDEDGDDYPPERQKVQVVASDLLKRGGKLLVELLDVTAAKDFANTTAKASVVLDGQTIVEDAPATFLSSSRSSSRTCTRSRADPPLTPPMVSGSWTRPRACGRRRRSRPRRRSSGRSCSTRPRRTTRRRCSSSPRTRRSVPG